ncbi:hypothetical protein WMF38_56910 [Sorangium sp. So ce118]
MKRQRKQAVRGHAKRIEKRLAKAATGRAAVVSTLNLDAWLRSWS